MNRTLPRAANRSYPLLPTLLFAGLSAFALAACNTVEGAGEDIESAGESIQDSADDD